MPSKPGDRHRSAVTSDPTPIETDRRTGGIEHFLSTKEVAARLGLDRSTVLRYLRTGKLAGSRINGSYRISERTVAEVLHHQAYTGHGTYTTSTTDRLLSAKEVARRLAVDPKTVVRYLNEGKLVGSRIGRVYRIRESSVIAFVRATTATAREHRGALATAIVNQRAGAGKTATGRNLALHLQRRGRRVLALDLDPQAALSVSLGVVPATLTTSMYRALMDAGLDPRSVIRETPSAVDVLPATIDLALAELELVNMMQRELVLRDLLSKLRPHYDHVVIDCPSSLGLLTINALAAADQLLIPVPCDELSQRSLTHLLRTIDLVKIRLNRELRVAGLLPYALDDQEAQRDEILATFRITFSGRIFEVITLGGGAAQASVARSSRDPDPAPAGESATAYARLAQEIDQG
jgi:chromosome partitioning protein